MNTSEDFMPVLQALDLSFLSSGGTDDTLNKGFGDKGLNLDLVGHI